MYSEKINTLLEMAIADGEISEQEKQVLFKNAQQEGIDIDEFEMVLQAKLFEKKKELQKNNIPGQANSSSSPSQSSKFGGPVLKCPSCGATYIPGTAVCPECGYAFTGIGTTRSAEKLYARLQEFNMKNQVQADGGIIKSYLRMWGMNDGGAGDIARRKMDIIQSFPVPNNREDLIDFLTSLQPKADIKGPKNGTTGGGLPGFYTKGKKEDLSYAYWLLFSNCINKAKVSFGKDKDFIPFIEWYDKVISSSSKGLFNISKKK